MFSQRVAAKSKAKRHSSRNLMFETLDERRVLSTFQVTTLSDNGTGSFRQAIINANNNPGRDTIAFASNVRGTINVNSALPQLSGDVDIQGPGPNVLTLNRASTDSFRFFRIPANVNVTISGLALTNGRIDASGGSFDGHGGAIANSGTLTLTDVRLQGNLATGVISAHISGGAVFNDAGATLTVARCTFVDNKTNRRDTIAGAIDNLGKATIVDSTFERNVSRKGGAIYSGPNSELSLDRVNFFSNTTNDGVGGGAVLGEGAKTLVTNSLFRENHANRPGGAILSIPSVTRSGSLVVRGSTFERNSTSAMGGAIYVQAGTLELTDSTLTNNSAEQGGAIAAVKSQSLMIRNSSIVDNTAKTQGGGISVFSGVLSLYSSIVAGNSGSSGVDIYADSVTSGGFNLIQNPSGATITGQVATNIIGKPHNLAALADNGGPVPTRMPFSNSSAIDKGNARRLPVDQRGFPSPVDVPGFNYNNAADGTDIGAVEFGTVVSSGPLIVTSLDDIDDGLCNASHCSLREAIKQANQNPAADTIRFATNLTGIVNLSRELPMLSGDVVIEGPGADVLTVRRDTGGLYRIFVIPTGANNATIKGLTIANGDGNGALGGGIFVGGTLTVDGVHVAGNRGFGGGIAGWGTITINNSTLSNNTAVMSAGGGLYVDNRGVATITNSTISGNKADSTGGGIANFGTTRIISSTIVANRTFESGGGLFNSGTADLGNSIVANNYVRKLGGLLYLPDDISGTVNSLNYNLIGNTYGATINGVTSRNKTNIDPELGVLSYNGGRTPTHMPAATSPVVDAGYAGGLTRDQRGQNRPVDQSAIANVIDGSDIGAVERPIILLGAVAQNVASAIVAQAATSSGESLRSEMPRSETTATPGESLRYAAAVDAALDMETDSGVFGRRSVRPVRSFDLTDVVWASGLDS